MSHFRHAPLIERAISERSVPVDYRRSLTTQIQAGREKEIGIECHWQEDGLEREGIPVLRPGQIYHMKVLLRPPVFAREEPVMRVRTGIDLFLVSSAPDILVVGELRCPVPFNDIEDFAHTFEIRVAAECPVKDLSLDFRFCETGHNRQTRMLFQQTVHLQGTYFPVDEKLLDASRIALDSPLPDNVAVLHVQAQSDTLLCLSGWSLRCQSLSPEELDRPAVSLAHFVEKEVQPREVRNIMRSFSRRSVHLVKWLRELYNRFREDLLLIIFDDALSEVPWEMIELKDELYLGAAVSVTHWITISEFHQYGELKVQEETYTGSITAYLHHEAEQPAERAALSRLAAGFCDTPSQLVERLNQEKENNLCGLVYLGSHGTFSYNDPQQVRIGSLRVPVEQLVLIDLEEVGQRSPLKRPLVFVNACHSGRLLRDSSGPYGLAEVILARIAGSYIGTRGPVGSCYAAEVAIEMLQEAEKQPDGVRPAELLRRLRQEAVTKLCCQSEENWLLFIYRFMYIYYGNPLARLRLAVPDCAGERHG